MSNVTKITRDVISNVVDLYEKNAESINEIASKVGISASSVSRIIKCLNAAQTNDVEKLEKAASSKLMLEFFVNFMTDVIAEETETVAEVEETAENSNIFSKFIHFVKSLISKIFK